MKNIHDYYLSELGKTESLISIILKEKLEVIDTTKFITNYKISNFWKGKFFIKRLINKIFKYKLNNKMTWNSKFWKEIQIQLITCKLSTKENYNHINITSSLNQKRLKNIRKYQSLIKNKIDLGNPLFITGECLNFIGGNVDEKIIYMLDGSRRIIALLLNNVTEIEILLINSKK